MRKTALGEVFAIATTLPIVDREIACRTTKEESGIVTIHNLLNKETFAVV